MLNIIDELKTAVDVDVISPALGHCSQLSNERNTNALFFLLPLVLCRLSGSWRILFPTNAVSCIAFKHIIHQFLLAVSFYCATH